MKTCFKCNKNKPLSEFNKNRTAKDGLRGYCKSCQKIYDRNYNKTTKAKINHLKTEKKYFKTEKGKINHRKAYKRFSIRHPKQIKAQNAVSRAIIANKMARSDTMLCHYCSKPAQHYHHWHGYEPEHRLDVIPVCRKCHYKRRKKIADIAAVKENKLWILK